MLNKYYCRLNITLYFEYRIREALLGKSTLIMSVFLSRCIISSRELKYTGEKKVFLFISWQEASINMRLKYAEKNWAREPVLFFLNYCFPLRDIRTLEPAEIAAFSCLLRKTWKPNFANKHVFFTILDQKIWMFLLFLQIINCLYLPYLKWKNILKEHVLSLFARKTWTKYN